MNTATKKTSREIAGQTASRVGQRLYGDHCGGANAAYAAEKETQGRTYYYAPNTRRYFKCRVSSCTSLLEGLCLATIESVKPPHDGKRFYRAVIFDLLGHVVYRTERETVYSSKACYREIDEFLVVNTVRSESQRILAARRAELRREMKTLKGK